MDMLKIGNFISTERKKLNISQRALGEYLYVTDKAISKWERGLSCPDTENLKSIALLFNCSISEILNGERRDASKTSNLPARPTERKENGDNYDCELNVEFNFNANSSSYISSYLFGDNLEHTRDSVNGGISAEMLKNRKFAGKPGRFGCANEWYQIGDKAYLYFGDPYTRHAEGYRMIRAHERNSQVITNYNGEKSGIGQSGFYLIANTEYKIELVCKTFSKINLLIEIKDQSNTVFYSFVKEVDFSDFETATFNFTSSENAKNAKMEISFCEKSTLTIGAASLMPTDNFHSMRWDVINKLKEIGVKLLRWPGGNFAGEYNWKDGLLPRNERAPFQSYLWLETQPHTFGYDFHEINIDDFLALCREIGAEPYVTINPTWNTPKESAEWVEYCNGDENTPYGRLRIERGYEKPYNVQFWSLGNEFGYGHMEGANTPYDYSKAVSAHAKEMLKVSSNLILCSSGPYPNEEWAEHSAKALCKISPIVSLHHYAHYPKFMDEAKREGEYYEFINKVYTEYFPQIFELRNQLTDDIKTSLDEWNAWYAWYRPGSVTEGIFAASFMHMLFNQADKYGIFLACHFESVNEGAINVYKNGVELTPTGQVFTVMKHHANGLVRALYEDFVATEKDEALTCTIINRSFDKEKIFNIPIKGEILTSELYSSDDVIPYSRFEKSNLKYEIIGDSLKIVMPSHSMALLKIKI